MTVYLTSDMNPSPPPAPSPVFMVEKSGHSQALSDTLAFSIMHLLCTSQTLPLALLEYGFFRLESFFF